MGTCWHKSQNDFTLQRSGWVIDFEDNCIHHSAVQWDSGPDHNTYLSAAWHIVPHVSAISSTRIATLSFTSPTKTILSTSFAFFLSLWMRANSTFSLSAIEVTLSYRKKYSTFRELFKKKKQSRDVFVTKHSFCLLANYHSENFARNETGKNNLNSLLINTTRVS